MFCHKCGNKSVGGGVFCNKCGEKFMVAEPQHAQATGFRDYVDNYVKENTKFQSAEDLLKNSKPWFFIWICFGVPVSVFTLLGIGVGHIDALGGLVLVGAFFGYGAMFIASGIIRMKYSRKFRGEFIGDIDIGDFIVFLNEHLKYISQDFHEWGYLSSKGLLSILENAIASATEEVRICSEFGLKRKRLIAFYIKPKTADAKHGEKLYFVDALKNGFLLDGRAKGFLGHGTLIRTAPILHAAMEYYLKSKRCIKILGNCESSEK